jgi:hypothetical protein
VGANRQNALNRWTKTGISSILHKNLAKQSDAGKRKCLMTADEGKSTGQADVRRGFSAETRKTRRIQEACLRKVCGR